MLLFTYYLQKANEDDLNRPSFFNSKIRKYFLLSCLILFFLVGEYLIIIEGLYNWTWYLPLFYLVAYYIIKEIRNKNIVIVKVFQYYKAFANPDIALSKNERLSVPVEFSLLKAGLPPEFCKKARKYLKKRIKEGKITSVRDLPNEAWTILSCVGADEIKENPENKIAESRIEYVYEERFEDKKHKNFTKVFSDWLWQLEVQFERLFRNYSFVSLPRPDFTEEEVQLAETKVFKGKHKETEGTEQYAVFPEVNWEMACKFGWVVDSDEYLALAALEFQRRYPEHKFSKQIKKLHKFSNNEIFEYAQNWEKLDISKIKMF